MLDKVVIAQILTTLFGFAVFMWVLVKYFWPGISSAIEARQQYIEDQFNSISDKQKELEAEQQEYKRQLARIQQEGETIKQEEIARGRQLAQQIEAEARTRVDEELKQARERTEIEIAKAREMLRQEVVSLSITITERMLKKQLDEASQDRLMSDFISQVKELQKSEGKKLDE